nr:MAG: hypothetical protein [Microvirus sp.]
MNILKKLHSFFSEGNLLAVSYRRKDVDAPCLLRGCSDITSNATLPYYDVSKYYDVSTYNSLLFFIFLYAVPGDIFYLTFAHGDFYVLNLSRTNIAHIKSYFGENRRTKLSYYRRRFVSFLTNN